MICAALNVLLRSDSGVLIWIDRKAKPKFDAEFNGKFANVVLGRRIRVEGPLGEYGGKSDRWKGRLEITITDLSQLKILDAKSDQAREQK